MAKLLDIFLSEKFVPTITKPTRVTHSSVTLIDSLYVQYTDESLYSGIIASDLSDYFPIYCLVTVVNDVRKTNTPLMFKHRPVCQESIYTLVRIMKEKDWEYLANMTTNEAYVSFKNYLDNVLNAIAPEKTVKIQLKNIIHN